MKNKTKLIILIPLAAVMLNGVGYLIALNLRSGQKPPGSGESSRSASLERLSDDRTADRTPERSSEEKAKEEKAMARRAAGLAALESGDYERALASFAEARAIAGDRAYVSELLRVTEDLAHRSTASRRVAPRPTPPPPSPTRFASRFRAPDRPAPKEQPPAPAPAAPVPAPPSSGLLLVTTTPRGLLVQVDDVPIDLTPTRASLKTGPHRVALFDGDRMVYETNVDVKGGAPTTVLRDLSAELAPPTPPAPASAFAKQEPAHSPAHSAAAPAPVAATSAPESRKGRAPGLSLASRPSSALPPIARTGNLDIAAPGLYGEVWINGRPWGFTPLSARDLPVGPTRIGVRVNGVEERSAIVAVRPGTTTSVKLSRQEATP